MRRPSCRRDSARFFRLWPNCDSDVGYNSVVPPRIEPDMQASFRLVALIVGIMSLMPLQAAAQSTPAMPPGVEVPQQSALSEAQLDQLTAAIALYSDPLIGQVLTAATYPLEV